MSAEHQWYQVENVSGVFSPSLLVYPDRIESNIRKMIEIAGGASNLRPHVKTHKMAEVIRLQMKHGISKFKCATISEGEMVARCGAADVLIAMQPVGPNIERFFRLKQEFKGCRISCIADSEYIIRQLSEVAVSTGLETEIWLDINNGMNRSGIVPGAEALRLYKTVKSLPGLKPCGLHVYDGHIHEKDFALREKICNDSFVPVQKMIGEMKTEGFTSFSVVAGGSPTFPVHALRKDVELSPGTVLLWDYVSGSSFSDLNFLNAAVLLTRIVSKPANDLMCIDLGHKAVGSEMPQPRIKIITPGDYNIISHSEEHMVIRTASSGNLNPGDPIYAIPWHVCPTVDRYDTVNVVTGSKVTEQWEVTARKRKISF